MSALAQGLNFGDRMLTDRTLFVARENRLSLVAEMMRKARMLDGDEKRIKDALLAAGPDKLKRFFTETPVIEILLAEGKADRIIVYRGESYGFANATEVTETFRELILLWKGSVEISFADADNERIRVIFKTPDRR